VCGPDVPRACLPLPAAHPHHNTPQRTHARHAFNHCTTYLLPLPLPAHTHGVTLPRIAAASRRRRRRYHRRTSDQAMRGLVRLP